jgi:hypothetical protein
MELPVSWELSSYEEVTERLEIQDDEMARTVVS